MPEISFKISRRMAELLSAGVISITADCFGSGNDIYGRVVQPHPRLGLYPHESFKLDELEASLEKVKVHSDVGPSPKGDAEVGPGTGPSTTPIKKGTPVKVTNRDDPEIGKIPEQITINRVANTLPKNSLCWKDLQHLNDDQLHRRLLSVGRNIGPDKAVSRIESMALLSSTSAPTLWAWWRDASTIQRWTLVTNAKLCGKAPSTGTAELLDRLVVGRYPFRGTDRNIPSFKGKALEETWEEDLQGHVENLRFSDEESEE